MTNEQDIDRRMQKNFFDRQFELARMGSITRDEAVRRNKQYLELHHWREHSTYCETDVLRPRAQCASLDIC